TTVTKPICDVQARHCVPCTSDAQCAKKDPNPGICVAHQDGRCAADAETIYVQMANGCGTAGSGRAATPFCSPQDAIAALTPTRRIILVTGPTATRGFDRPGTPAPQPA